MLENLSIGKGLVAIECQGEQHYQPVKIFDGEEGFKKRVERDILKKKSLQTMNIPLIEIGYDHPNIEMFIKDSLF